MHVYINMNSLQQSQKRLISFTVYISSTFFCYFVKCCYLKVVSFLNKFPDTSTFIFCRLDKILCCNGLDWGLLVKLMFILKYTQHYRFLCFTLSQRKPFDETLYLFRNTQNTLGFTMIPLWNINTKSEKIYLAIRILFRNTHTTLLVFMFHNDIITQYKNQGCCVNFWINMMFHQEVQ